MKFDAEVVAVSAGRKDKISDRAARTILAAGSFSGRGSASAHAIWADSP